MNLVRSWIEISRSAFNHNISLLTGTLHPLQLAIIIKANAYGHGLLKVAALAQENPEIAMLCVIDQEEAYQLRAAGITKPILILSYRITDPAQLLSLNSAVIVYDEEMIAMINSAAQQYNQKIRIHIKVDTGLSRLGFFAEQIPPLLAKIKVWYSHVIVEGILTHLSDKRPESTAWSLHQISLFTQLIRELSTSGYSIPMIHTLSSNACMLPSPRATHARIGHHVYGFWRNLPTLHTQEGQEGHLKLIGTWKTRIYQLKTLPANTAVGYIRTYTTTKVTRLAILPVGYSDGYPRSLSNKGHVLIHGHLAPICGIISMNLIAVDVTDILAHHEVNINDEVILMGEQHPAVHPDTLSQQADSIPVEISSRINHDIPRIIVD